MHTPKSTSSFSKIPRKINELSTIGRQFLWNQMHRTYGQPGAAAKHPHIPPAIPEGQTYRGGVPSVANPYAPRPPSCHDLWMGSLKFVVALLLLTALTVIVADDFFESRRRHVVLSLAKQKDAQGAYESRCLIENLSWRRRLYVLINGVTTQGVVNANYDEECQILSSRKDNAPDLDNYAFSKYLSSFSSSWMWKLLAAAALVVAFYTYESNPKVYVLSMLLSAVFIAAAQLHDGLARVALLKWLTSSWWADVFE